MSDGRIHGEAPCAWGAPCNCPKAPDGVRPDLDRAIAIIEESRQTHVNWADWRRKGNGTDTDHEMIGDLEWHENAIRDYDHVLAVLRGAAPRAEGLDCQHPEEERVRHFVVWASSPPREERYESCAACGNRLSRPSDTAPRAEGLDELAQLRRIAAAAGRVSDAAVRSADIKAYAGTGLMMALGELDAELGKPLRRLSRPSDERDGEGE